MIGNINRIDVIEQINEYSMHFIGAPIVTLKVEYHKISNLINFVLSF